ncbi:MAG: DinB family protein [Candidatus Dormibacteraceae bacterium]
MAEGRAREAELEALCVDAPSDPSGRWAAKDHLAHLAWWRDRNANLVEAARTGSEPPPRVEDDAQNAIIYQANRERPAAEIVAEARQSWDRIAAAIEACSEDDLLISHPHEKDRNLLDSGPANGGHLGTHLMYWYLDSGDEAAAEAAMLWAYELEAAAAADAKARAYASYNLACLYGRFGHAGPALPLLRESFEGVPELLDWARTDPDLDPIRGDGEVAALLLG